jgi:hypothetical protein
MITMTSLSPEALAQARYALFEKLKRCQEKLELAREVYGIDSVGPNVVFWSHECQRVGAALYECGGRP